ncbi:MAG: hypothetical protein V4617_03755 [Gemmatimonadota bacterium]
MPATAIGAFVVPVAAISALVADESGRAATGAMIAGSAYAAGATIVLVRAPTRCSSTSSLIYIWTPFAAAAGALIATR